MDVSLLPQLINHSAQRSTFKQLVSSDLQLVTD